MDVRLPDGTVIKNVPDGMSKADLTAKLKANGYDVAKLGGESQAPAQDDPGALMATVIGAGRAADKVVKGVKQGYYAARSKLAPKSVSDLVTGGNEWDRKLQAMDAEEADNDRIYAGLQAQHPIATAVGEVVPGMAIPVGAAGTAASLAARTAAASSIPGLLSYGTAEQRLKRGAVDAVGGGVGALVGRAVGRALKPAGIGAKGASDEAMRAAERVGYKPTPGQVTQNAAQLNLENYLARSPGSSGAMKRVADANQQAINRAAARSMGETADDLSEGVFSAAQKRIGGNFGQLEAATNPQLGNDFLNALGRIDADNAARGPFRSKAVDDLVNKSLDLAQSGQLSGTAYKQIRTELNNSAQSAFKNGDATLGQAYKAVRDQLDDAARASLGPQGGMAWDTARKQYQNWKTLTKANVAEGGNVSPARVASAVRARGPQLRTGQASGELSDIARIGESFKTAQNPNSGGLVHGMLYGNPVTGIPAAIGNKALSAMYLSDLGQAYLTRGLLDVGPTGQLLLGRSGGLLGVSGTRGLLGVE